MSFAVDAHAPAAGLGPAATGASAFEANAVGGFVDGAEIGIGAYVDGAAAALGAVGDAAFGVGWTKVASKC